MCSGKGSKTKAWHFTLRAVILCLNSNLFREAISYLQNLLHFKPSSHDLNSVLFVIDIGIGKIKQWDGDHTDEDDEDESCRYHSDNASLLASFSELKEQFKTSHPENSFFSQIFKEWQRVFPLRSSSRVSPFTDHHPAPLFAEGDGR
jgi:hypothetical protein